LGYQWLRDAVAIAVEALSWMELEGLSERLAFTKTTRQLGIRNTDSMRAAFPLVLETVRALNLIDRIATSFLSRDTFEDLDLGKRNFLRVFIWWTVLRRSSREDSVALLEAARHVLGWKELRELEFVFGKVLAFNLGRFLQNTQDPERTALSTLNRTWFVSYCYRTFGRDFALKYLKATLTAPPTYIRINVSENGQQSLIRKMEEERVRLGAVEGLNGLFQVLNSQKPLTLTEAYKLGLFSIQDKSSYLSTLVAEPKKGEMVLDMCAAPGGKTSHVATMTGDEATIYSIDLSRRRMSVWKKEMRRCKVSCATPIIADGRQELPIDRSFDLVLVDPPCTNSGAFGKTPSMKWQMTPDTFRRLCHIQSNMLCVTAQAVKPGGRLVYSTCSITPEENESQIEQLMRLNPEFKLERQVPFVGHGGMRGLDKCQRLYPHLDGCNGYFIALLRKED
jgi:16S rRNA (cytosine967-C5)-methyltransferase